MRKLSLLVVMVLVGLTAAGSSTCKSRSIEDATAILTRRSTTCNSLEVKGSAAPSATALAAFTAALAADTRMRRLAIVNTELGPSGVAAVADALAARNVDLLELTLAGTGAGDAGASALVEFLARSNALRELSLAGNGLSNGAASALADVLPPALHELDLSHNAIGDAGLLALIHAAADTLIREIELDDNAVTSKGAHDAAALLHELDDQLRELDLEENDIDADAVTALYAAGTARRNAGRPIKIAVSRRRSKREALPRSSLPRRRPAAAAWDERQVRDWVTALHPSFKKYGNGFIDSAVNGEVLLAVTDSDLAAMGVDNALHRKRILVAVQALTSTDEL